MESPERRKSIIDLLADLENAATIPAKQRANNISSAVDGVCLRGYEDGLDDASLERLIDIITQPSQLGQGTIGSLIKNLYPASKVSDDIVVKVIGCLGHGSAKPSYGTQADLLKWLIMVYDVLENQRVLARFYGVLFNLLDTISIRSRLCHVLSLITQRKHVRPFRIQVLMELTRQAGNDPPLVGLMRVYKDYYPDVIVGDLTSGRASVFTHPNREWRERLGEIREAYLQKTLDAVAPEERTFKVTRRSANRKHASLIPEVHTSLAQESSITLEEIGSVDEFVRHLEKIELPNQLVAAIGDPLLQKFLQLKHSEATAQRVDNWLLAFFEDQLEAPDSAEGNILGMLEAIRDYTRYTKQLPPACLTYLQSMVFSWNGYAGREVILDLLSYIPIGPYEGLYQSIFVPLEDAILDDTAESKLAILGFYNNVLRQWSTILASSSQRSPQDSATISSLVDHANLLALTSLQSSSAVITGSEVLTFYETIAYIISQPELRTAVRIITPPSELVYTLYFTHSLSILSRLCSILALYKRAFELATSPKESATDTQSYPMEYTNNFNGFLLDICNCIWRSRAFNTSEMNALGCLLPEQITSILAKYVSSLNTSVSLPGLFGLSYSPVLCQLAISHVRECEDKEDTIDLRHAGPVTQGSLKQLQKDGGLSLSWADYRLGVLRYLENNGGPGVGQLMYNTMKQLMTARENMT